MPDIPSKSGWLKSSNSRSASTLSPKGLELFMSIIWRLSLVGLIATKQRCVSLDNGSFNVSFLPRACGYSHSRNFWSSMRVQEQDCHGGDFGANKHPTGEKNSKKRTRMRMRTEPRQETKTKQKQGLWLWPKNIKTNGVLNITTGRTEVTRSKRSKGHTFPIACKALPGFFFH